MIEISRWALFIYGIYLIKIGKMEIGSLLIIYNYFTQLVDGFSELLSQELKVPVFIAESPLTCVAEGTGILLDNLHMLDR